MAGVQASEIVEWSKIDPWFVHQVAEIVLSSRNPLCAFESLDKYLLLEANGTASDFQLANPSRRNGKKKSASGAEGGADSDLKSSTPAPRNFSLYALLYRHTRTKISRSSARKKVVISEAAPTGIRQGIEFDYCCVHAVMAQRRGYETSWSTANRNRFDRLRTPTVYFNL